MNLENVIEETFWQLNLNLDILTNVWGDTFFRPYHLASTAISDSFLIAWTDVLCLYYPDCSIEDSMYMRNDKERWHYIWESNRLRFCTSTFLNVSYFSCSQIHIMLLATMAYVICLVGIISMYIWYVPQPTCLLNIFFITWTLVLLQLMTSVSLHPKVSSNTI